PAIFSYITRVGPPTGLWAELDGGRLAELGQNEFFRRRTLGFQKVRTYNKLQEKSKPCRTKTQQHLGGWYPAELEGCDAKCIEEIGQGKACYLKLGELSFEAVKFALCDSASRVSPVL
ncbi:histidinol-phosphatase, partial [Pseudomonas aeruginosa]